jgi:hypothetical protein
MVRVAGHRDAGLDECGLGWAVAETKRDNLDVTLCWMQMMVDLGVFEAVEARFWIGGCLCEG